MRYSALENFISDISQKTKANLPEETFILNYLKIVIPFTN